MKRIEKFVFVFSPFFPVVYLFLLSLSLFFLIYLQHPNAHLALT